MQPYKDWPRYCVDERWLSSTVLDLVHLIHTESLFERLPILADALMDAGCDNEQMLNACAAAPTDRSHHQRGSWVIDTLISFYYGSKTLQEFRAAGRNRSVAIPDKNRQVVISRLYRFGARVTWRLNYKAPKYLGQISPQVCVSQDFRHFHDRVTRSTRSVLLSFRILYETMRRKQSLDEHRDEVFSKVELLKELEPDTYDVIVDEIAEEMLLTQVYDEMAHGDCDRWLEQLQIVLDDQVP